MIQDGVPTRAVRQRPTHRPKLHDDEQLVVATGVDDLAVQRLDGDTVGIDRLYGRLELQCL
jgi:hypothetical protein